MDCVRSYLQEQIACHPGMEPRDVIKLCYQAAYGGDHLLTDLVGAENYFYKEFKAVPPRSVPLYELISPEMARVNLAAWKQAGLPGAWLLRLFTLSAEMHIRGDLSAYLDEADTLNIPGFREARIAYELDGCPSVHHSDSYRCLEQPAYRVVHRQLLRLIPILEKAAVYKEMTPCVLAIDGRAASGKTTMGAQLARVLNGSVIHMDHFFLPPDLRTHARLNVPGGNIHYERFCEEVLPNLGKTEPFTYRRFDCGRMDYASEPFVVPGGLWRIVEGSYSLHPEFGRYYDISVFSSVTPETQLARIGMRNGYQIKVFTPDDITVVG